MARLYAVYLAEGKEPVILPASRGEKIEQQKVAEYMAQKKKIDDYYVLNNYKLPVDFFLSEVFYCKTGIDKVNISYFSQKDIIDAGACIGDSALILSECISEGGKVYAFEPVQENFHLMQKTIELNNSKNIVPVKLGLGDVEQKVSIIKNEANIGGNKINKSLGGDEKNQMEEIQITTIDKYVKENDLNVGLIKADVEGFEQNMLKGAIETIKKFKPTLLICIYHNPSDFFDIKPMLEALNLGYKFKIAIPKSACKSYPIVETMLIAEVGLK